MMISSSRNLKSFQIVESRCSVRSSLVFLGQATSAAIIPLPLRLFSKVQNHARAGASSGDLFLSLDYSCFSGRNADAPTPGWISVLLPLHQSGFRQKIQQLVHQAFPLIRLKEELRVGRAVQDHQLFGLRRLFELLPNLGGESITAAGYE